MKRVGGKKRDYVAAKRANGRERDLFRRVENDKKKVESEQKSRRRSRGI